MAEIIVKLSYFQEEMMIKENLIKIGEGKNLKKKQIKKLCDSRHACRLHTMSC